MRGGKIRVLLSLMLACSYLCGCVRDERNGCVETFRHDLVFYYPGNTGEDIFAEKIEKVHLFVYDDRGTRVENFLIDRGQLEEYQGTTLQLQNGTYTIVCWANADRYTELMDVGEFDTAELYQSQYLTGPKITDFDSLYYARRISLIERDVEKTDVVTFTSSHINLQVYIEGGDLPASRAAGDPVEVRNISVGYDFAMSLLEQRSVMYPRWITDVTGTILLSEFRLLRFGDDNPIVINILDPQGGVRASVSLAEFLKENGITVEGVNEVTIPIYIRIDGTYVNVSVAGWDSEEVRPIFKV